MKAMIREEFTPAKFGPPDPEGFRTVSFYGNDSAEVLRLGLNIEYLKQHLTRTVDLKQYSDYEQNGLRTAAVDTE